MVELGHLAEARDVLERALAISTDLDDAYFGVTAVHNLATVLRLEGELCRADELLASGASALEALDHVDVQAHWYANWAVVALDLGHMGRAADLAALSMARAKEAGDGFARCEALWADGEVRLACGEPSDEVFREGLAHAHEHGRCGPMRQLELLAGLAFGCDRLDVAARCVAVANAILEADMIVLPSGVTTRLEVVHDRSTGVVGTERWAQHIADASTRPINELLSALARIVSP
ncbi:MAG: hypothetical protein ACRD07_21825 [Acidimicrobiales bacterium]